MVRPLPTRLGALLLALAMLAGPALACVPHGAAHGAPALAGEMAGHGATEEGHCGEPEPAPVPDCAVVCCADPALPAVAALVVPADVGVDLALLAAVAVDAPRPSAPAPTPPPGPPPVPPLRTHLAVSVLLI